jgi:uroporphyrin-III C-methyltransferase
MSSDKGEGKGRGKGKGTVYLVGAGPGDPELLTLKGARLLSEADAVVYDALVSESILERSGPDAEMCFVGKRGGQHFVPQDEINDLLVELARRHSKVVRLKGGDPYLFGRGAEEEHHLRARGVSVEVVPGVTSAIAAPAAAGIPLTHRDHASAVVIATGHRRADEGDFARDHWSKIGRVDATVSVLMGVKNLEEIVAGLMAGGRDPETPAALIQWGTTERQRELVATLGTIAERQRQEGFGPPSVLVVGSVVDVAGGATE